MFARLFRRSLLLSFLLVAVAQAQTSTLTPSQAAAISAEETRWNAQDLGEFSYGSITSSVVKIAPAKKLVTTPDPAPGTVAVQMVEHLTGGKSKFPGFQPIVYWLVPDGAGGWKTGYYQHAKPAYIDRIDGPLPTEQAARAVFAQPQFVTKQDVNRLQQAMPMIIAGLVLAVILLAMATSPIWIGIWALKRNAVPTSVICPGCGTENFPTPSACGNCGSTNTVLVKGGKNKQGHYVVSTACRACKSRTKFDPYCVVCETNLTRQLLDGSGKLSTGAVSYGARK